MHCVSPYVPKAIFYIRAVIIFQLVHYKCFSWAAHEYWIPYVVRIRGHVRVCIRGRGRSYVRGRDRIRISIYVSVLVSV